MKFDDFVGKPLPRMLERVKVKLRDQDLDFFEYGGQYPPPFLYFKSRYINEEFPGFPEQQEFDRQLEALGLPMADGLRPRAGRVRQLAAESASRDRRPPADPVDPHPVPRRTLRPELHLPPAD